MKILETIIKAVGYLLAFIVALFIAIFIVALLFISLMGCDRVEESLVCMLAYPTIFLITTLVFVFLYTRVKTMTKKLKDMPKESRDIGTKKRIISIVATLMIIFGLLIFVVAGYQACTTHQITHYSDGTVEEYLCGPISPLDYGMYKKKYDRYVEEYGDKPLHYSDQYGACYGRCCDPYIEKDGDKVYISEFDWILSSHNCYDTCYGRCWPPGPNYRVIGLSIFMVLLGLILILVAKRGVGRESPKEENTTINTNEKQKIKT